MTSSTVMTMVDLRAECARIGIRPARSKAVTIGRIQFRTNAAATIARAALCHLRTIMEGCDIRVRKHGE